MKNSIWFQTDLGYTVTKETLSQAQSQEGGGKPAFSMDQNDYGGRLTFHSARSKDVTFQITTNGKLGIYYPDGTSYEPFLEQLKPYLVRADHTLATMFNPVYHKENKEGFVPKKYVPASKDFRAYRSIFKHLLNNPAGPRKFLEGLCRKCSRNPHTAPALQALCDPCKGNLYSLVEELLSPNICGSEELQNAIAWFLAYEYKAQLFLLAYDELVKELATLNEEEWELAKSETFRRLHNLERRDSSLEPNIPEYFVGLLRVSSEKAKEAIKISMNLVRWHLINESCAWDEEFDEGFLAKKQDDAEEEFDNIAYPLIEEAWKKPSSYGNLYWIHQMDLSSRKVEKSGSSKSK